MQHLLGGDRPVPDGVDAQRWPVLRFGSQAGKLELDTCTLIRWPGRKRRNTLPSPAVGPGLLGRPGDRVGAVAALVVERVEAAVEPQRPRMSWTRTAYPWAAYQLGWANR